MSRERLRLCCGLQCTDRLHPNGPRQRQKLFHAALKLLWFAIGIESVRCENAAQVALHAAIRPLLRLEDGHVLATLSAIVLALCEGRTGLAISGVFGAGKTRSAAVLLAGLLVFDPSLKLMVLTKENIAAHAVAEHLVSLQMPDYLQEKMGRLDTPWCSNIGDTAQELEVFLRMSRERLRLCCGLQCTDRLLPMGLVSARSSFMQLSNCYGSPLESRVFGVKMRHRLLYMLPSGHFSALKTDMSWLR